MNLKTLVAALEIICDNFIRSRITGGRIVEHTDSLQIVIRVPKISEQDVPFLTVPLTGPDAGEVVFIDDERLREYAVPSDDEGGINTALRILARAKMDLAKVELQNQQLKDEVSCIFAG